jgi:tRNA (adenine57-N1/adenine58-N1)-methyltransferase
MVENAPEREFNCAQIGDLVQLVSPTNKSFIITLKPGDLFHTHRGIIRYDDLIGKSWGSAITSHTGRIFYLVKPSLADILRATKRSTQIMYPKDIGFILVMMGIGPGKRVIEAGTGSGALTTALAWSVGTSGHVWSYENRQEMQILASKNLELLGFSDRVSFVLRDIKDGFDEEGVDALFLDVHNPYDFILQVKNALALGSFFGSIVPTTNQVSKLITALEQAQFGFIDVCETSLRFYKPVADRLRPTDRMVAHTGYLVFARPMLAPLQIEPPSE